MTGSSDLENIQSRLRQFRDDRDWRQFHTPKNLAAAIAVEAAEFQELFLWADQSGEAEVLAAKRPAIEEELADVLIQCLNLAEVAEVDVVRTIDDKIDRNESRYPVEKARGRATKHNKL